MKKYVSLIVCAILSLTALFLPIGKDARFDGKGSGKNESVTNISELNKVLEGKSGTYTFEFDEGLSLDRYSLYIKQANAADDKQVDYVPVYVDGFASRVTDLHASNKNSKGYGRLANDLDFVSFVDLDMKNGMVKIEYQNDSFGKGDYSTWTSIGYCSATELGMDTREADEAIVIYSDSDLTNQVMTMDVKDVFVYEGSEDGAIKVRYSEGDGITIGYIKSSAKFTAIKVMVYAPDGSTSSLKVFSNKIIGKYNKEDTRFATTLEWMNANKAAANLAVGSVFRYYGSQREVYRYQNKVTNQTSETTVESATISYNTGSSWEKGYIENGSAYIVAASVFSERWVNNSQSGKIKLFVESPTCYYAQIQLDITMANGTFEIYRTAFDAELYVNGDVELIKFNTFFHQDDGGKTNDAEREALKTKMAFVDATKVNQWVTTEEAKIYLDAAEAANAEFVSPFNEFANKYLYNGNLVWALALSNFGADIYQADGSEYSIKENLAKDFCQSYYHLVAGSGYDYYLPSAQDIPVNLSSYLDIDLSDSERPVIKSNYIYELPEGDIYKHNSSVFESASDRTLVIENIGNTIIPKVVAKEIQKVIG